MRDHRRCSLLHCFVVLLDCLGLFAHEAVRDGARHVRGDERRPCRVKRLFVDELVVVPQELLSFTEPWIHTT